MEMQSIVQTAEILSFLIFAGGIFFMYLKIIKLSKCNLNLSKENDQLKKTLSKNHAKENKDAAARYLQNALDSYQKQAGIEGKGNLFHAEMIKIMEESGVFSWAEIFCFKKASFKPYELASECFKLMSKLQ